MINNKSEQLPNAINFREPAVIEPNQELRVKRLFRSGYLADLTELEADRLSSAYNIQTVIDFRMDHEVERHPDVLPASMGYYRVPVLPFTDQPSFKEKLIQRFKKPVDSMVQLYRGMLTDSHAVAAYKTFFDILLNLAEQDGAIVFHCTAGKDRTGVAAMLLEGALGLSDEDIRSDYLRTNEWLHEAAVQMAASGSRRVNEMNERPASDAYFDAVLAIVQSEYDGWTDYLNKCLGVTASEIEKLKAAYLV